MGKTRRVDPHDLAWEAAFRAKNRLAHPPTPMMSANSKPPIYMWICGEEHCQAIEHTYKLIPPICCGGYSTKTEAR